MTSERAALAGTTRLFLNCDLVGSTALKQVAFDRNRQDPIIRALQDIHGSKPCLPPSDIVNLAEAIHQDPSWPCLIHLTRPLHRDFELGVDGQAAWRSK